MQGQEMTPEDILMMDETAKRDCSEEVAMYEGDDVVGQGVSIDKMQRFSEVPENAVVMYSMDGNRYLLDLTTVDWAETVKPENMQNLRANEDYIRAVFREVIFDHTMGDAPNAGYDTAPAVDAVRAFVRGFGLEPQYAETYPTATAYDLDILWCNDALEICRIVATQCEIWKATHNTEEEMKDENSDNSAD